MLMPRRVKHRKVMRGRMSGMAKGGHTVAFGDYGLATQEPAWITSRQIEAARRAGGNRGPPDGGGPAADAPLRKARRKDLDRVLPEQPRHEEASRDPDGL